MKKYIIGRKLLQFFISLVLTYFIVTSCNTIKSNSDKGASNNVQHKVVYFEDGRFAAWPANGGMWAWDNEILVCFTVAHHAEKSGHTYDGATARNMFARSLDGGESWAMEDAFQQGITAKAMDHHLGDNAKETLDLNKPIDFSNPNFAFMFQRETNRRGPTHFYYTYDRGKSWLGPYNFPELDTAGITNRTDYIIDGKHEMLVFLSIGHGRTGVARTIDGGQNWELLSYIGPDFTRSEDNSGYNEYSLMPSSIRLSSTEILTTIRHREGEEGRVWITSYLSEDNAKTWQKLPDPVNDNVNSPPALVQLEDGRLVLVYIFRRGGWNIDEKVENNSSVCARISSDNGRSWGNEIVLRENDGANSDVGYPKLVIRPDGKLVITYYWNHSLFEDKSPYRYIAATIWEP
jgi:hypothetical protein